MNIVVKILMKRDGLTEEEAKHEVEMVRDMIEDCDYDPEQAEEIIMSELGLELDYVTDILDI
mgnify:CR=1 FL=1|jgi:hypothetical protein